MNISFIGLGKLGLPLACCLAQSGNRVLGVDKNEYVLEKLSNNELPFYEPGLTDIFPHDNLIGFTESYQRAVEETEASIILVNTQLGDTGYSAEFVESALTDLAVNLKKSDKEYHLIVLSSTVLPGTIVKLIKLVEKISGRKFEEGFGFSYVPDFVKLGSVIKDFLNPEFFLIGANNWDDHGKTQSIWAKFHENKPVHKYLTLEEAEVAKVALNAYIVSKISFANFLGQLCDGMDNVNVHKITDTIGIDKRISPHFFGFGTPFGGTCFPRDTAAFIKFAETQGKDAKHIKFCNEVNESLYHDILNKCGEVQRVGVIGVSFKPNSPVTIGSPSVRLIYDLLKQGRLVYTYDELEETYDNLNGREEKIIKCVSAQECVAKSDVVVFMHPTKKYATIDLQGTTVVDNWGIFSSEKW
jgi:UDPglucose 6-dehydrogenase